MTQHTIELLSVNPVIRSEIRLRNILVRCVLQKIFLSLANLKTKLFFWIMVVFDNSFVIIDTISKR